MDGDRGGRGRESEGSSADTARKRPERPWTAARTKEMLRRCPLAIAQRLVHCAIAVSTAESQGQCPLHCCRGTTRSERSPTFAAQLHLPAQDLFWANLRVQLHLPPLDLAWNPVRVCVTGPLHFRQFISVHFLRQHSFKVLHHAAFIQRRYLVTLVFGL